MLKKIAFAVCFATQLVALTCSNPVTLSTPGQDCGTPKVAMNENGDIVAIWEVEDEVSDDEYLYTAVKKKNGEWGPSSLFARNNDWIFVKRFKIDASSHVQAVVQLDRDDLDDLFQWTEKKWGDSLPTVTEYTQPFPDAYSWEGALNDEGKWALIKEIPGDSSGSKQIVVASVIPGQTEITRTVVTQFEGWAYNKRVIFDGKNRMVALWVESTRGVKSYQSIYTLKMAREKDDGSWTLPETACEEFNDIYRLKIKADAHGNVALAWEKGEDLYAMTLQAGAWSKPVMIASSEQDPNSPRLTFDKEGNLLATWKGKSEKKRVIYAAFKPVDKLWQASVLTTPASTHSWSYKVKADNRGDFVLVWEQDVTKKVSEIYGAIFSAQSEKWSAPIRLSPAGQNCVMPNFTLLGNGKGALAWLLIEKCGNRFIQVAELKID